MIGKPEDGWTDERLEHMRRRWVDDAKSASIIGDELGISRSAVIGKVHRNGWQRRAPTAPPHEKKSYVRTSNIARRGARLSPKPKQPRAKPQPRPDGSREPRWTPPSTSLEMPATAIPFINRTARHCPWCLEPADAPASPEMMVCGAYVESGEVWCKPHKARCYSPEKPKQNLFDPDRNIVRRAA